MQALKVGLLTSLATLPSPPNDTGTSGPEVAARAAANAAGGSSDTVGCGQSTGGTIVQGVSSKGSSGGGADGSAGLDAADLSIQGRRMALQPQPQRTPAKPSLPPPPPPAPADPVSAAWTAMPATPAEAATAARGHGGAAGATSVPDAHISSAAAAAASVRKPQASAAKPPRQPQPGGRLSIAERAAALLDGCATDADRRVGTSNRERSTSTREPDLRT